VKRVPAELVFDPRDGQQKEFPPSQGCSPETAINVGSKPALGSHVGLKDLQRSSRRIAASSSLRRMIAADCLKV
jgi:hypothetical protein